MNSHRPPTGVTPGLAVAAVLLATACATSLPRTAADPAGVVAVADTQLGLAGRLNTQLRQLGWRLVAYQPAFAAGLAPETVSSELAERARYRLELRAAEVGICANRQTHYIYDIRLIDNRGGGRVFHRAGSGCAIEIATDFAFRLRQKGLVPASTDQGA